MSPDTPAQEYPGKSIGLPPAGPGSIAPLSRRVGAFVTDWAAVVLLSMAFFDYEWWSTLLIFIVIQTIFLPTAGGSPGHRLWRLRVIRRGGGWVGVWRPFMRSVLIVLVIPAAIWDENQRGLHDLLADTVIVRG
ncbi:RDD family protein [Microbacterium sp. G2-8]|uniref:RDD family protein n=1 Tax=Microbacterium sp. G2-8 TaxID=2842454 RepID=UPI001C8A8553|nr:RDD family protein [Microbacterium sp. G2-8]